MKVRGDSQELRHLKAGEVVISAEPLVVSTILGSCISVTMYHPARTTGAICHGLLPEGTCAEGAPQALQYVDCSIRHMVRRLEALGLSRDQLEVKLFGGADVLAHSGSGGRNSSIGGKNLQAAYRALEREGLKIRARDVGGERGRKLLFVPCTGEIYVKRLQKLSPRTLTCENPFRRENPEGRAR